MSPSEKGNGHAEERRTGVDRRVGTDLPYEGPERRTKPTRRRSDRAPDKPIRP